MRWGIWEDRLGPIWGRFEDNENIERYKSTFKNFRLHNNSWDALKDWENRKKALSKSNSENVIGAICVKS